MVTAATRVKESHTSFLLESEMKLVLRRRQTLTLLKPCADEAVPLNTLPRSSSLCHRKQSRLQTMATVHLIRLEQQGRQNYHSNKSSKI